MSRKVRELTPEKLRKQCDPNQFKFEDTGELSPLGGVVGQERALEAIDFGVKMRNNGYNIYVLGPVGAGRTTTVKELIERQARKMPTPDDWCYVYNFNNPDEPNAISLPAGKGKVFKRKMEKFIRELRIAIPNALNSEDYQREKNMILQAFQQMQNAQLLEQDKRARASGFALQKGPMGFLLVPTKEGQTMTPEMYDALSEDEQNRLDEIGNRLREDLDKTIREIHKKEQSIKSDLMKLERETVKFAIGHHIGDLREEFSDYDEIISYFDQAESDLLDNIDDFKPASEGEDKGNILAIGTAEDIDSFKRFLVNVIVDNSKIKGAPVVIETNPTYNNLIGRIDKESHMGALFTDFTMIKGGSLHKANGGFLIIEAEHIFRTAFAYEALKRTIKNQAVRITDLSEEYSYVSTKTLEPEPIPLHTKVILIGSGYIYYALYNLDNEFRELFKVKADFNSEMKRTRKNEMQYAHFIRNRCRDESLMHFDRGAVSRVVEYGSELVEDQGKLSTRFAEICDIVREANYWAVQHEHTRVMENDVQEAIEARKYRSNRSEELIQEMINEGTIFIDVMGEKVGQVNGLAVLSNGDYSFGKPTRISVRTFLGKSGVVAIDREAKMSGRIHDKGVLILSGYLNGKFGTKKQVSISAMITFEQNYEGVDGDSASSTELYGILSSLADMPIKQGIAVTGSVNQWGEVQPIGGVNSKIEGFFDICKQRGLTGEQGVLIPTSNVKNLMLRREIVDAVRESKFHIYPVATIDEGIEILTGVPAGRLGPKGEYPKGTVNWAVDNNIREMADLLDDPQKNKNDQGTKSKQSDDRTSSK